MHDSNRIAGHEYLSTVDYSSADCDTNYAAPPAHADQCTEHGFAKHPRKNVAVGSRVTIEQRHHRTDKDAIRISVADTVRARIIYAEQLAPQPFDQHARNVAAAIRAHIDNQCLLVDLRIVPFDEFANAVGAHIGNVNVTHAAGGRFFDLLAIVRDPIEID